MSGKSILELANEFSRACAAAASAEQNAANSLVSFKPLESVALKVHAKRVEEAREDAKRKGVPVEFKPNGCPVFTSSRQFRAYARAYGFVHRGY